MIKGWIQPGDTVWTNYNGVLTFHTVLGREANGYYVRLSSGKLIGINGVHSWKNYAVVQLKWYKLKHKILGGNGWL